MQWIMKSEREALPFRESLLDGPLIPKQADANQVQGHAYRSEVNGHTIITFWDRTGDSRPGSKSVFVVEGNLSMREVIERARLAFPAVFRRFTFSIVSQEQLAIPGDEWRLIWEPN
jgi:hypothetical protein